MALAISLGALACDGGVITTDAASATTMPGTGTPDATHMRLLPGEPVQADLDGDGVSEQIEIDPEDDSLTISDGSVFYRSRDKWRVVQAALGDTDHDGLKEVVTLLDSENGRHLGLFAYFGGAYRERFVTQAIVPTPTAIEVVASAAGAAPDAGTAPSTGDLVVLIQPSAEGGDPHRTLLRWNGFGYTRVETSPDTE